MKNGVYAGIIAVCILVAAIVFVKTRGGASGVDALSDTEMTWVWCAECKGGYEMPLKQLLKEVREKSTATASGMPITRPVTCKLCGKDGIFRGYKCAKCGEIFRAGAVQGQIEDRCPNEKCKFSAMEAERNARKAKTQQGG